MPQHLIPQGLAELVSAGLVSSDGFAGLRALIADHDAAIRAGYNIVLPRERMQAGNGVW